MSAGEFNNFVMKGIGIVIVLIILAVIVMSFLGNERRKQEVTTLQRQLKERFENKSPSPSSSEGLDDILRALEEINENKP